MHWQSHINIQQIASYEYDVPDGRQYGTKLHSEGEQMTAAAFAIVQAGTHAAPHCELTYKCLILGGSSMVVHA